MDLPREFEERMKLSLGGEYPAFRESYDREPVRGLRVNTLKAEVADFTGASPWSLRPVAWCPAGFYYDKQDRPGRSPLHEAGVYYIQEPSAMSAAELAWEELTQAAPHRGEGFRILDLCAAPGGKSTQLAAKMEGLGLLVSNEIIQSRAKILSSNIERMGVRNAVVTNETPKQLACRFQSFFDLVVVDAPCSGEGMFRRDEEARRQWSPENVAMCAARQQEILEEAAEMTAPGGILSYSTCTFSEDEDEGVVEAFLVKHHEFSCLKQRRIMPHKEEGEGHFAAVLKRKGSLADFTPPMKEVPLKGRLPEAWNLYREFAEDVLLFETELSHEVKPASGGFPETAVPVLFGDNLYLMPCFIDLSGIKTVRAGLHLGTVRKNRFEPSHALALTLKASEAGIICELPSEGGTVLKYLRGESLPFDGEKGWTLVCTDGYSLGWGKTSGGVLKNHYPKGLRING